MKRVLMLGIIAPALMFGQTFSVVQGGRPIVNGDTVLLSFKVQNADGIAEQAIPGDRVSLEENGRAIAEFDLSYAEVPGSDRVYSVLVLDASGSMRYEGKLDRLKQAARTAVDAMTARDFCSLIAFSSRPRLLAGFTDDKSTLRSRINDIAADGYTAIYDAVWEAVVQVQSQPREVPKVILLITDGSEEGASLFGLQDIATRLQTVPNLSLHVFDLNKTSVHDLRRLAKIGSGSYHHNPKPSKVFRAFGEFLTEHRKQFIIRYVPPAGTGAHRTVAVSVRLNGLDQTFETSYQRPAGESSLSGAALIAAGLITACVAGVAGTVVYTRQRKRNSKRPAHIFSEPLLVEAPRMVFDIIGGDNGEEKTHALTADEDEDREKTIIIQSRLKEPPVFAHLTVTDVGGKTEILDIDSPEVLFGRSAQCVARFDNMEVSRLHAKLRLEAEGFVLYDLGSANGTRVNGEEVQKRALKAGDEIEVGNNIIIFHPADSNGANT